ncbi:MAG: glycoside hydrolase family 3 N-terminal domain-containing protein [Cyclonatronaceae bacterium]
MRFHFFPHAAVHHAVLPKSALLKTVLLSYLLVLSVQPGAVQAGQNNHIDSDEPGLREMIGQMLLVGFGPGTEVTDRLYSDITEYNLGGVILFAYNVDGPASLRQLTGDIRRDASTPIFIAIDQEGGHVARLNENTGYSSTLSAEALGELDSEQATRDQAALMAGWLSDGGINLNLAPVVDLNINPDSPAIGNLNRSFSDDPAVVTDHASWFIDEFRQRDILTALKHFPGHGSATEDSHLGFTDISDTWKVKELEPYEQLLAQGYSGMIMPGHLYHEDIDPDHPATLSGAFIEGKIRDELGFGGVIVSDGMFMRAIQNHYGFFESVKMAINAGMDILLYSANTYDGDPLVPQIVDFVEGQVDAGIIERQTIEDSYARIMQMKDEHLPTSAFDLADGSDVPQDFNLANYPNPFNPVTTISFELPRQKQVSLAVYDIQGRRVAELANGILGAGRHSFAFDASRLSSGVYVYRLVAGERQITQKMLLVK